jgi:hypothetical protein
MKIQVNWKNFRRGKYERGSEKREENPKPESVKNR